MWQPPRPQPQGQGDPQQPPQNLPVLQRPPGAEAPQQCPALQDLDNYEGESTVTHPSDNTQNCCRHKLKKVKSGFLDKPDTNVQHKVLVPHMAQNRCFVHKPTSFEKLSFECFIAGEARIVEKCKCPEEMLG